MNHLALLHSAVWALMRNKTYLTIQRLRKKTAKGRSASGRNGAR